MPDGTEIDFPEGTDPAVMSKAASDYWAKNGKPANPFSGKSLSELKSTYRGSRLVDAGDDTRRKIMDAYVEQEAKEGGFGFALDDVGRQLAKGVPVIGGVLDEASAGLNSLLPESLGGAPYDESLDYQRARDRYRETLNPETSGAVQIAGGIAGTVAGARAAGIGYGAGSTTPILQRAVTGGLATAPVVGADAFARGEGGLESRAQQGAVGAALGLPLGAAAPVVAQGLSSGIGRLANFLSSDQALRQLGISRNAAEVLLRQLGVDDTLTRGAARIRQGGPDAMLADAGPAAANLLDTALERSGPGSTAARNAIEQRATQANQNLRGTLDQTMGAPVGVETRQAGIRQATAAARGNAYDAAYNTPIDYSTPGGQEIARLWARVSPARRNAANRLLEEGGHAPIEDGALPDVRQIDFVTRALNDVAQSGEGQGALGGVNAAGRSAQELSRGLRDALRGAVPEYATALQTAADPIRRVQATEFGSTLLNKQVTREQVAREFATMTGPERQAAISGMRDQIDELAANVKAMASDPNIDARQLREVLGSLTSQAAGEKIAAALGPAATRTFMRRVRESMRALELRASVARNSRTFGRTATNEQVKAQLEPGIVNTALEGRPMAAIRKAMQALTGLTPERRLVMEDRLFGEIANALTQTRGRAAERYVRQLERALRSRANSARTGQAVGNIGADAYLGATIEPTTSLLRPAAP